MRAKRWRRENDAACWRLAPDWQVPRSIEQEDINRRLDMTAFDGMSAPLRNFFNNEICVNIEPPGMRQTVHMIRLGQRDERGCIQYWDSMARQDFRRHMREAGHKL